MAKVFFVSDVHIRSPKDERHNKFLEFLNYIEKNKASQLFITGDLFEFFYGSSDYMVKKYNILFSRLEELASSGIKIYYLYGNHDFEFNLPNDLITKAPSLDNLDLNGKRVIVFHGDGLDPMDIKYRILKSILRSSGFKFITRLIPQGFLYWLASRFSSLSRRVKLKSRDSDGLVPYRNNAFRRLICDDADMVVYSHTHVAELSLIVAISEKPRLYMNTGFFAEQGTYGMLDDNTVYVGVFEN